MNLLAYSAIAQDYKQGYIINLVRSLNKANKFMTIVSTDYKGNNALITYALQSKTEKINELIKIIESMDNYHLRQVISQVFNNKNK